MKKLLCLALAVMMAATVSVSAFAASSDSLDVAGGTLEGGCGRSGTTAYASSMFHAGSGFNKSFTVKTTCEAVNYQTGSSFGSRTSSGSQLNNIYRATVTVPSSTKVSVYGAHQITLDGKTYGFYTEDINV